MDIVIMALLYVEAFRQLGKKEQKRTKNQNTYWKKLNSRRLECFLVQPKIVNKIKSHPLVNHGNHILN